MKKDISITQKGFTLIEIILYLSLSVLMVTLIAGVGINILSIYQTAKLDTSLQYNTSFVVEKIKLITADAISIQWPPAGTNSTSLTLEMALSENNPTRIELVDGRLVLQEGDKTPIFLSGSQTALSAVEFSNVTPVGGIGSLRIFLQFPLLKKGNVVSAPIYKDFYTTVNLQYP